MSIFLVGGGPDTVTTPVVFDRFMREVRHRAGGGRVARIVVAPSRAIIGGYRVRGTEVCGEECSEGLDEVEIRDGLGLVPFAVDVHAAQAGTLGRAVAAVVSGLVDKAVAVDENTALVLPHSDPQEQRAIGTGNCWLVRGTGHKATVSVLSAG